MCGGGCQSVTVRRIAGRLRLPEDEAAALVAEPGFPPPRGEITASSPPLRSHPFWLWDDVKRWCLSERPALLAR